MTSTVTLAEQQLKDAVRKAALEAMAAGELPEAELPPVAVEIPGDRAHGDLASNIAMLSARAFHKAPRQIADILLSHLSLGGTYLERAETAGPGFSHFSLPGIFTPRRWPRFWSKRTSTAGRTTVRGKR